MNTEENSEMMMEEDFELPHHPILSFADDEFLGHIVERLTSLVDPNYNQGFGGIMKELTFHDVEMNELKQISFCENTFCSKSMSKGDLYFICLDCDLNTHPNLYSLLCYECYDKSNHQGHRLYIRKGTKSSSGTCDCGDVRSIKPEGFCPNHQFKPINIQELYENFPKELRARFEKLTNKSIYGAVSLFELKQQGLPEEIFDLLSDLADDFVSEMLDFWIECYSGVNRAFLPILWTTLRGQFESPWDLVWHDCGDLQAGNNISQEPHQCTCGLLGNLLRISNLINKENQGKLKKLLAECGKDEDFLGHLAIEFTKYIRYFFTQDYDLEASENSVIWRLYFHLYQGDKTLGNVLDSGYFENILNVIKKVVEDCPEMNRIASLTIFQIRKMLDYFLMPTNMNAQRLAKDERFLLQHLDVVMMYQMKFYYTDRLTINLFDHQIDYDSINMTLEAEKNLCKSFENALKIIFDLPHDEQNKTIGQFLKPWYMSLQNAKAALKDENGELCQSFDPCLERLFCCILINYLKDDISTGNLEKFMQENFDCVDEVAVNTIEGPLRALGMIRYLHLTFNYKSGDIFDIYYSNYNAFFEIDVGITQMMLSVLKPEQELFELLVENFFSYSLEIQSFFKDSKEENYEKKKLTVIEDFLYFLVFLMTNEICLLNVQSKCQRENFGQIDLNPRQKLVVKDLLVNILRGYYWTTGKDITKICDNFLPPNQEIDQILLEVSVKDETNQKIRLKDEYESGVDPYIFYKLPSIRQDILETLIEKNSLIDLVSGGGGLDRHDLPQYLRDIQIKLYQSNLPEFLCKYLKTVNIKTNVALIRIVLKLILLNLQVAVESSLLRENIKNNYLNDDFLMILDSIDDNCKDCKNCIENIKKLLQKFQGKRTMLVESSPQTQKKEEAENAKKKLTAQERMEKLKQSFAQKQAAFAQKNESMLQLQKSMSFEETEEAKKDDNLVCQHCMEKLHVSGKEYGLLIYINFTNNFYDTEGVFVEQDYKNLLKADWWPVISSCNHYFHRKCFEILYKAPKNFEKNYMSNAYESFCPLCKGLCNNFLSINGNEAIQGDDINQEVSQGQLDMYPQIHQTFTKKIQKILVDLKAKIQLSPAEHSTELEEASFVSIETIFERAYQYFIESFYLLENPQALEKSFALYFAFFRGFKSYFKSPENKLSEDNLQLSAFFNVNNLFLSTQTSMNYKTEIFLIELLAKNLQKILKASDDDISGQSELLALKDFVLLKIVQTIAFNHFESSQNFNLEGCLTVYQSNQTLKTAILNELVFPIQKIILSYALNISAISSALDLPELCNILYNITDNKEEYLTSLFQAANISCSFPELIAQIFQELPSRPQSELNFLNSLFDANLFNKETLKPQLVKFAPRMIQLPENYLEFNIKYFPQKCNLCKKYSSHLFTSICLICGEIMCTSYCNNDANQAGNLNRHSKKYHMGIGVFLDIQHLHRNLVNSPLNLDSNRKSLYLNKIGQDIVSFSKRNSAKIMAKLDFGDFHVNQEYLKELNEMIIQQGLRKEIFRVGLKFGEKVEDSFL